MAEVLDLMAVEGVVLRSAFLALLQTGDVVTSDQIANTTGLPESRVRAALQVLVAAGRVELDHLGQVVGAGGLFLIPTKHRLYLREKQFHTWCAEDAVGIPAALRESARVTSICDYCHAAIELNIIGGVVPDLPPVISWPSGSCDSVREDFCPTVNFFCSQGHFTASLGDTPGVSSLSLKDADELGRTMWSWARA